jgi:archaeosine synthase
MAPGGEALFTSDKNNGETYDLVPRYPLPHAAHKEVLERFEEPDTEQKIKEGPSARLLHPNDLPPAPLADMYVLSDSHGLFCDPQRFVEVITGWREELVPDSALFLPAAATPQNALLLVYAGADILDSTVATLRAHQEIYLHPLGEWLLDSMKTLPCGCSHCVKNDIEDIIKAGEEERRGFLERHNTGALHTQVKLARELIGRGGLRNALESQALSSPSLAAVLRHLDRHPDYLHRRASVHKGEQVLSCGQDSLNRPEVILYRERLLSRVTVPASVVVLLPCSARKPYSTSPSHRRFRRILGKLPPMAREVIISSPLGAIPRELEAAWPCAHYDAATTGYWDAEEVSVMAGALKDYLDKIKPEEIVACLSGGYLKTAKKALDEVDIQINLVTLDELRSTVLDAIDRTAGSTQGMPRPDAWMDAVRFTAEYQFRECAGDALCSGARVVSRARRRVLYSGDVELATVSPLSGLLQLTMEGGRRLETAEPPMVKIDDFVPSGSVLAPGVLDVDPEIRSGDEVLFRGPKSFGVGRARMAGWEMKRAVRGVAVQVRHVEELK